MADREAQFNREVEYDEAAAAARLAALREQAAEGSVQHPRATRLVHAAVDHVAAFLEQHAAALTRGPGAKFRAWLRALEPEVAALIAVRTALNVCANSPRGCTVQKVGIRIGNLWELEVRINEARAVNPMYMDRVERQIRGRYTQSEKHIRGVMHYAYGAVMKGELDSGLPQSDYLHMGKAGVEACLDAGLLVQERTKGPRGILVLLHLSEDARAFLNDYSENDVRRIFSREHTAMLCPPDPWRTVRDGGYLTDKRKWLCPLLAWSDMRPEWRKHLTETLTAETHPTTFEVANYLQSTAFEVHQPTLERLREAYRRGGALMGLPAKDLPAMPACPMAPDWTKEGATEEELQVFTAWKLQAARWYEQQREWRSSVRKLSALLRSIQGLSGAFWFPVFLDRRGRWYYRGVPNPQGSDMDKALLHLAEKKPLGERGLFWLKVHLANCLGYDKERLQDRADWVDQHWERLQSAIDAPWDDPEVWGTDDPWCALAAAYELRAALQSGNPAEYRTGIVVHQDATCSGLQHFSAMLKDPVGAAYVNLTDTGTGPKKCIYTKVAEVAVANALRDVGGEHDKLAKWWVQHGISRDLAKHPVMTYVYGATLRGTAQAIEANLYLTGEELNPPAGVPMYELCMYAARKLFAGIAGTVPAAAAAMQWLRSVAASRSGKPLLWTSPSGFPVIQDYPKYNEKAVKIRSCNLVEVLVREQTEELNKQRMANAVAPNFVHSLDAAHLALTAKRMQEQGLQMVAIHDSFGTHPCDVEAMRDILREEFVKMYADKDRLAEFLWSVEAVGEVLPRGNLDLNQALTSEFLFC